MATANKYTNFISPRGTAKYPKTSTPMSWSQAQNRSVPDADGQYEMKIVVASAVAAPFVKVIQAAIKESGITPKNVPFKKLMEQDGKTPTGFVEFTFKAYGKKKDGTVNKINFFDGKAKPAKGLELTSGSEVKVSGYISVAKLGARLTMRDVQVLKLAEADAGPNPFQAEEGAYEFDNETSTIEDDNIPFSDEDTDNGSTEDDGIDF